MRNTRPKILQPNLAIAIELFCYGKLRPLVYIGKAADAFLPDGSFKAPQTTKLLRRLMERTLLLARQLKSNDSI